jgi:2-polyprenyl-3-methyl-5-hydroxy-6-metoxy-1,4-benzoquinol methylase
MNNICEICGGKFNEVYSGTIRDGSYGRYQIHAIVYECTDCKVQRLREVDCIPDEFYETGQYREQLEESLESKNAVIEQDEMQHHTLQALFPKSLRGENILDVGCGAGSLLDMLKNVSSSQIGIEPCGPYLKSLTKRGYKIYPSVSKAIEGGEGMIDYGFSIQVIEHVKNPVEFLKQIKKLIKPGGRLLVSTPNRNDILMTLLKNKFYKFFYRTQHRWYFDECSLIKCAELAGFSVENVRFIHRYGMANALYWLKDGKPRGGLAMRGIDDMQDKFWKASLEKNKQSDNIYISLMVKE